MATGYQNASSNTPGPCPPIGPSTSMTYYHPPDREQLATLLWNSHWSMIATPPPVAVPWEPAVLGGGKMTSKRPPTATLLPFPDRKVSHLALGKFSTSLWLIGGPDLDFPEKLEPDLRPVRLQRCQHRSPLTLAFQPLGANRARVVSAPVQTPARVPRPPRRRCASPGGTRAPCFPDPRRRRPERWRGSGSHRAGR